MIRNLIFATAGVSLLGNWEQYKELALRHTTIEELKLEKAALTSSNQYTQEQLEQLRMDYKDFQRQAEAQNNAKKALEKEMEALRVEKSRAQNHVTQLGQELRNLELTGQLSEVQRKQLQKELKEARENLEVKDRNINTKDEQFMKLSADYLQTRQQMSDLSIHTCGALTPRGLVKMTNDAVSVSPWAMSIAGNIVLSAVVTFAWWCLRLLMQPQRALLALRKREHANGLHPAQERGSVWYDRFVRLISKGAAWSVGIFALVYLPVILMHMAGNQAMNAMESTRYAVCTGSWWDSWCHFAFDTAITPNAVIFAQGETYMHYVRSWNRFALAQGLALAAEGLVVLSIRAVVATLALAGTALGIGQHRLENGKKATRGPAKGQRVAVKVDFESTAGAVLSKGLQGEVVDLWDNEISIAFAGIKRNQWVIAKNFDKLDFFEVIKPPLPPLPPSTGTTSGTSTSR